MSSLCVVFLPILPPANIKEPREVREPGNTVSDGALEIEKYKLRH